MMHDQPLHIEPLTDFSREPARQAMRAALAQVGKQLGASFPPVIDNKPAQPPAWFDSVNPSRKTQVVGRCGRSSPQQAEEAIAAAKRAFPAWRDTPVKKRAQHLL